MNRQLIPLIALTLAIPATAEITADPLGFATLSAELAIDGKIALPIPAPYITQAYIQSGTTRQPVDIAYNTDATEVSLILPASEKPLPVTLEIAEKTTAFADGRIILSAFDAKTIGEKAKLESHPGTHRIGFWSNPADFVQWDYKPTRWGMYSVELTYSLAGGQSDIEIEFGGTKLPGTIQSTGTWYRYTTASLGKIYLAEDTPTTLSVRCTKKSGGAVMNLKAVTLRPAPESDTAIIPPAENGDLLLMANTATVSGLKLRYEPKDIKQCIGFWTIPEDTAAWQFEIPSPGSFDVEIWQGCGGGNGGSDVEILVGDQTLSFKVEDTGHFQKFVPRAIGQVNFDKPGTYSLQIRPKNKTNGAVMDVQKIILKKK